MRVVLTTVKEANVKIDNQIVGSISKGYLLLVGFTHDDHEALVDRMVDKIINLRVFMDENGKTNLSLTDVNGEILSISQFTLYASSKGSRRPSFTDALRPDEANRLYLYFNDKIKEKLGKVETGQFGADMDVYSINEGPFTLILDSKELFN